MRIEVELDDKGVLCSLVVDGKKLVDAEKLAGYATSVTMSFSTTPGIGEELKITTFV